MHKFPSIDQFRNVIRAVQLQARYVGKNEAGEPTYNEARPLPVLTFRGTVKLHGTNAGIVYENGEVYFQSRENVITPEKDNAGFAARMSQSRVNQLIDYIRRSFLAPETATICIYGEWCGQGIQKGVAISELPKRLVIFAVKIDGEWMDIAGLNFNSIDDVFYNATLFTTWEIDIDFANPQMAQNKMIEITEAVEAECPVGKAFDVCGIGEGVVWWCKTPGYSGHVFKVKGEKHSVTKVRTLAAVDIEKLEGINAFVDSVITDQRLEQGLDVLELSGLPFEMKSMGDFIRWVFNDAMKEEGDTADASGLDRKALGSPIAIKARQWYVKRLNA